MELNFQNKGMITELECRFYYLSSTSKGQKFRNRDTRCVDPF